MAELFALIFQLYEDEFLQKKSFRLRENSKYYFYSYMKTQSIIYFPKGKSALVLLPIYEMNFVQKQGCSS